MRIEIVSEESCESDIEWSQNYTVGQNMLSFDKICFGLNDFYGIVSHFFNDENAT